MRVCVNAADANVHVRCERALPTHLCIAILCASLLILWRCAQHVEVRLGRTMTLPVAVAVLVIDLLLALLLGGTHTSTQKARGAAAAQVDVRLSRADIWASHLSLPPPVHALCTAGLHRQPHQWPGAAGSQPRPCPWPGFRDLASAGVQRCSSQRQPAMHLPVARAGGPADVLMRHGAAAAILAV
jgi:hypothetical protein